MQGFKSESCLLHSFAFKVPGLHIEAKAPDCWSALRDIIYKIRNWERKHSHCKALSYVKMHFFKNVMSTLDVPWNSLHLNVLATSSRAADSWESWSQVLTGYLVLCGLPKSLILSIKLSREKYMLLIQFFFPVQTNESSLFSKEFKSQE